MVRVPDCVNVSEGGSCANWPGGQGPAGPVSAPGLIFNCNLPEWVICFEARAGRIRRFTAAGRHRLCLVAPEAPLVVQEGRYLDYTGNRAPPMVCTLGPRCLATRRSGRAQSKRSASVSIPSLLDFVNRASGCDHLEFGAAAIFRNALTTDGYLLANASDI